MVEPPGANRAVFSWSKIRLRSRPQLGSQGLPIDRVLPQISALIAGGVQLGMVDDAKRDRPVVAGFQATGL